MERAGVQSEAADAFGVRPSPWWKRMRGADAAAPNRVAGMVGFVTAFVLWGEGEAFHGFAGRLLGVAVLLVPGFAVERFYKARRRRRREQLLPPP